MNIHICFPSIIYRILIKNIRFAKVFHIQRAAFICFEMQCFIMRIISLKLSNKVIVIRLRKRYFNFRPCSIEYQLVNVEHNKTGINTTKFDWSQNGRSLCGYIEQSYQHTRKT